MEQINQRISSLVEAGCSANEMSEVKSSVLGLKVNLLKSIRRWNGTFGKILAQQVWSLKLNSILLASYLPSRIIVKIYVFTDTSSRLVSVVFDSVLEPLHLKGYVSFIRAPSQLKSPSRVQEQEERYAKDKNILTNRK